MENRCVTYTYVCIPMSDPRNLSIFVSIVLFNQVSIKVCIEKGEKKNKIIEIEFNL